MSKYVMVGCGLRSGSVYIQEVLKALGLDIGHETPEKDGVVGWQHLLQTHPLTMRAMRKARNHGRKPIIWLMQVRNPVDTINSIAAMYERGDWPPIPTMAPVNYVMRIMKSETPLVKAMKLYYHINDRGMRNGNYDLRYRVEDLPIVWPSIAELVGKPGVELPDIPTNLNSHKDKGGYQDMTWDEMMAASPEMGRVIEQMANAMRYNLLPLWGGIDPGEELCKGKNENE